jgi:hypothetical protein
MQAHLLYYYIPTGRFRNPSATLRSRGYRVDGSVWVIPTDRLPWNLINRMKATPGVVCNEHKFDVEEASRLTATARAELSRQVLAASNAVQKKASTEYDPEKWETVEEFEKWLAGQVRAVARRAARMLADYAKAGEGFGLSEGELRIEAALSQVRIVELVSRNRARVYAEGTAKLRQVGQAALAGAAEKDQLPPAMMADLLRDAGLDDEADKVQDAFVGAA